MKRRELPMLAGIAACLRWLEELAAILSGPLLTVGLGIALVDLLTDGRLLAAQPMLLYAWAISQSIGVDAQLVGSAAKLSAALRQRRPWIVVGYIALVAVLAYVGYVASLVFATQEAQGISTAAALARLGMDQTAWLWQRSGLAVLLVVLSGLLRYTPPAEATAEDERAALERELSLEPLRARARMQKALGWRNLGGAIIQGASVEPSESRPTAPHEASGMDASDGPPQRPPTGPGSPAAAGRTSRGSNPEPTLQLVAPPKPKRKRMSAEQKVRRLLEREPDLGTKEIARRLRISASAASKWKGIIAAERTTTAHQAAQ